MRPCRSEQLRGQSEGRRRDFHVGKSTGAGLPVGEFLTVEADAGRARVLCFVVPCAIACGPVSRPTLSAATDGDGLVWSPGHD